MALCWTRRQSRSPARSRTSSDPAPRERRRQTRVARFASWASLRGSMRSSSARPDSSRRASSSPSSPERASFIDVTLQVAGAEEAITVRGGLPSQDSRKVETGATYGEQELKTIPTTRDPWAILRQVPGILISSVYVGDGAGASQPGVVGKGAGGNQNTYQHRRRHDLAGGFRTRPFDFDSLDSIGVATGGSDPSLSSPGVTINLVTKRGTNTIAGSARALYTDGSQWDYGFELGGPLWKDRSGSGAPAPGTPTSARRNSCPTASPSAARMRTVTGTPSSRRSSSPANALTLGYFSHTRLVDGRGAGPERLGADDSRHHLADRVLQGRGLSGSVGEALRSTQLFVLADRTEGGSQGWSRHAGRPGCRLCLEK